MKYKHPILHRIFPKAYNLTHRVSLLDPVRDFVFGYKYHKLGIGVCLEIDPNDDKFKIKIGKGTHSGFIRVIYPIDYKKYEISIGNYTIFGKNVKFLLSDNHTPQFVSTAMSDIVMKQKGYLKIGNDVWIGEDVIIKGNLTIGDGAVIGAKALVTKDVPPFAIVGGVPARLIHYRFNKQIRQQLLKIRWWDWSKEKVNANKRYLSNPEEFIKKFKSKN